MTRDVLIITDIGTDVDDAEAISLAIRSEELNIIGIACTASEPQKRVEIASKLLSMLETDRRLGLRVPVGYGAHFIDSVMTATKGKKDILLIAQATDLSKALNDAPSLKDNIDRIWFMGQAIPDEKGWLIPDSAAFNVSEDYHAAQRLFEIQNEVPFTIVGKYAVYPLALSRNVFDRYEKDGGEAGAYLKRAAISSITAFAKGNPERFKKVYNIPQETPTEEALSNLENISNPYDAVTVLAMLYPECFHPDSLGIHTLIGTTPEKSGLITDKVSFLKERLELIFFNFAGNR